MILFASEFHGNESWINSTSPTEFSKVTDCSATGTLKAFIPVSGAFIDEAPSFAKAVVDIGIIEKNKITESKFTKILLFINNSSCQ
jgi:hypothetical protein